MKHRAARITVLLAVCVLLCPARADSAKTISMAEFRGQLSELESKIESLEKHPEAAAGIQTALPDSVKVATSRGEVEVRYLALKNDLAAFSRGDAARRPTLLLHLRSYVHALATEAEAYDQPADSSAARKKLDTILARKEFSRVHGPSAFDLWLDRVLRWLGRLLGRMRTPGQATWTVLQVIVYGLAAAALGTLLIWTIMRLARPAAEEGPREIIPFSPSAKGWRTWLAEARVFAQQQDWANAIHLAYWAGISYLEEHGAWKPNRARTPREYLRLLGAWTPQHPPLAALTRKFEVVWYGRRPAGEPDFEETLSELERLGCR
jgi:hypothetical protein